jgi:hypothetical protein
MASTKATAWAVEHVENGKTEIHFHPQRNSSPEEAKDAFVEHMGIPWKELERRGARVVEHEVPGLPPKYEP